jgi:Ca-activated chloride channel homolog
LKKIVYISIIFIFHFTSNLFAQNENALIRKGNKLYKEKQFDQSQQQYQKAIEKSPGNPTSNYNLGNVQFRKNSFEDATKSYQTTIDHANDNTIKENASYNQGVALIKQKKLEESINAWKNSLKLDPNDIDARENLQKALQELKSKQPPPPPQKKDDKKDQDKKQDPQKDNKDQQNQQQQQPQSKLTKKQVDQLLKALQQRENEAQEKMNQNKAKSLSQPDKDW